MHKLVRPLAGSLVAVMFVGGASVVAQDDASDDSMTAFSVVPPDQDPLGVSYGQWGERWWKWLISIPAEENPGMVDNCGAGQEGDVFLIPQVGPGESLETSCTVAEGQYILATPGGTICDAPDYGETPEERLACVEADKGVFSNMSVVVDGEPVPDIESYWVVSDDFDFTYTEGNPWDMPAMDTQATMGGWFVMIEPLPAGSHTIVVSDDIDMGEEEGGILNATLTANVEVVPAE